MDIKKRILIFMSFFALLLSSGLASANPIIDFASGRLIDAQTISIRGAGFGSSGPNIVVFDDFSGSVGDEVNLQATVGSWTSTGSPQYVADGNNVAARLLNDTDSNQVRVEFSPVQEVFLSYKVKIPSDNHFPNTVNRGDFAPDSAWKLAWIMDATTGRGYDGDDDISLPSWADGTRFYIGGNDNAFPATAANGWSATRVGQPRTETNWFSFTGWNRATTYLKGGADPINDNGLIWFSGLSEEFGQKQFSWIDRPIFDGDDNDNDNAVSQWSKLNLSGWHRTGGVNSAYDSMTRAYYDDIYFATGNNAAARVEIGNKPTYEDCTKLAISTPDEWSDGQLTVTVRQGGFLMNDEVYLFVVDAENRSSAGFGPFKFGAPIVLPPLPPGNIRILEN